ncbi:hypothetical protein BH11BAC7_BH11BAC7_01580 [soil metagenome]
MTFYQIADFLVKFIALGATAIGAIIAAIVFRKNVRLEKHKWLIVFLTNYSESDFKNIPALISEIEKLEK